MRATTRIPAFFAFAISIFLLGSVAFPRQAGGLRSGSLIPTDGVAINRTAGSLPAAPIAPLNPSQFFAEAISVPVGSEPFSVATGDSE